MNLARVTAVHPETNKVDLLFIADGRPVPGVRVMCADASTASGTIGLALPDAQAKGDPYAPPAAGERVLIACVGYYDGLPVVQGFLFPEVSEMLFPDPERVMVRTPSDFYHTVDGKGNAEWFHPGGAYVRIGTSPAHEDLTGKDRHGLFNPRRNAGEKVHIHIEQAGGVASVDIAPDGKITITSKSDLVAEFEGRADVHTVGETIIKADAGATIKAPSILLDTDAARCTGTLTVDKLLTYKGGMAGSGGSGGAAAVITGKVRVTEDVEAGGISFVGHTHTEQGDGADVSKPK